MGLPTATFTHTPENLFKIIQIKTSEVTELEHLLLVLNLQFGSDKVG